MENVYFAEIGFCPRGFVAVPAVRPHYTNDSAKNKTTELVAYKVLQLTQPSVRWHCAGA